MNIAITGTVSSGKSKVAAIMADSMHIEPVDTDMLCRELLLPGQPCWHEVRECWQGRFFDPDNNLDRKRLREAVFSEPDVRKGLENILHPRVRQEVAKRRSEAIRRGRHLLVEVPLLFETGWQEDYDHIVAVYAPGAICIARTMLRDNVSLEQAKCILALQLSAEEKAGLADSVVDNSGTWSATVLQISRLARDLQQSVSD